jgi:hypothetical protein
VSLRRPNRRGAAILVTAGLLLSTGPLLYAATLTSEIDGIGVELTSTPTRPEAKAETEYLVRLVDRAGQPVTGVQVTLRGAMADGVSVVAPFRSAEQAGLYRGRMLFTMEGTWELMLRVTRDGKRFELPLTERVGR